MNYCSIKRAQTASSHTPLSELAPISSFMHVALILQHSLEIDTQSPAKSLLSLTYGAAAPDPDPELDQELALNQGLNSRSSD